MSWEVYIYPIQTSLAIDRWYLVWWWTIVRWVLMVLLWVWVWVWVSSRSRKSIQDVDENHVKTTPMRSWVLSINQPIESLQPFDRIESIEVLSTQIWQVGSRERYVSLQKLLRSYLSQTYHISTTSATYKEFEWLSLEPSLRDLIHKAYYGSYQSSTNTTSADQYEILERFKEYVRHHQHK